MSMDTAESWPDNNISIDERGILKAALDRALNNGLKEGFPIVSNTIHGLSWRRNGFINSRMHYQLIFSREFARSFWGDGGHSLDNMGNDRYNFDGFMGLHVKRWEYHLQQMVISPSPLEYLNKFLDGDE